MGEFTKDFGLKEARAEACKRKKVAKTQNTSLARVRKEEKKDKARIEKMPTFQKLAENWLDLKTAEWEERSAKQNRQQAAVEDSRGN